MSADISVPAFTPAEAASRGTFLALMWALSLPGRVQMLPVSAPVEAFTAIADSLLDLETSFYTHDEALAAHCRRTTARAETVQRAEYLFLPHLQEDDLPTLASASIGTMLYPDQGATIIVGGTVTNGSNSSADRSTALRLTGPGIQGETAIAIGGIPPAFWTLREQTRRYPLGWDIFVVSGAQVIALPRSTKITCK
ncbi:MAG TPA: phosphonate C-P lyase system protein PhnH [Aggregatilineales bacterium]|nr:phosphonate C-P lyase system protein PhnH [Aggregatilineales bacterium]